MSAEAPTVAQDESLGDDRALGAVCRHPGVEHGVHRRHALNVALPALQARSCGPAARELLWIVNAYALLLAALILLGGALGDRYGRKRVFMAGHRAVRLASLACGLAPTTGFLIAARAVQGIGGALMVPGSLAIISASFGAARRGQAIGTWSARSAR